MAGKNADRVRKSRNRTGSRATGTGSSATDDVTDDVSNLASFPLLFATSLHYRDPWANIDNGPLLFFLLLSSGGVGMGRLSAPSVWNSLPASVIESDSLSVFKSRLKTFLFRRYFG